MCGIVGIYDLKQQNRIDRNTLKAMAQALYHRGPDQYGFHTEEHLGFGFSRLSIVDLENGMQPMISEDGTVVSICNGEIFNHLEIRESLIAKGHRFRTQCDAEVILRLYLEYGDSFPSKLNGQFAFAIYDKKRQQLYAARDPVGIIPFFYTVVDGLFIFGSEIKSILVHPAVPKAVDLVGLDQVLTFPGLISPRTMFKNIKSMRPGWDLVVTPNQGVQPREYWDLIYPKLGQTTHTLSEAEYLEEFDEVFTRATKRRLMADVPVGLYLSGGLDSSLVGAKMRALQGVNADIRSFSIAFEDKLISEEKYQRGMAKFLKTNHQEQTFLNLDTLEKLKKTVFHTESVLKETFNAASLTLSELARAHHIRVVLAGQGADELLAGYVGYRFDEHRASQPPPTDICSSERALRQALWASDRFLYEKNHTLFNQTKRALYSRGVVDQFSTNDCTQHFVVNPERIEDRHPLHKRSYLDVKLRLADHLLSGHGDRMAMAHSVETRYPFLDTDVLDFVTRLPPWMKLKEFKEKYILKQYARKILPKAVVKRDKFEFTAPGSPFILNLNSEYVEHLLSHNTLKHQGYFDPDEVQRLKTEYRKPGFRIHMPYESDLLIVVISFGVFLDVFDMPDL